jgi:predicted Kef-type K+ transport protein
MMALFIRRFIGALVLDAGAYEDIESDRRAGAMSMAVVALTCAAGAFAAMNVSESGVPGFAAAMALTIGGWMVWASLISAIGTRMLPEPETKSNPRELFRTIGFAAAPGVFYAFAAMPAATPFVFAVVSAWMIAATVLAVRQALDFRSTGRAIAVCVISWLLSIGLVFAIGTLFTQPVS